MSGQDAGASARPIASRTRSLGNASCPANPTASTLHSELRTSGEPPTPTEGRLECPTCWLVFRCCQPLCTTREPSGVARLVSSWWVPSPHSPPAAAGFLFGGL